MLITIKPNYVTHNILMRQTVGRFDFIFTYDDVYHPPNTIERRPAEFVEK